MTKSEQLIDILSRVEQKVDGVTERVGKVETKIDDVTTRISKVETKVDQVVEHQCEHAGYHAGLAEAQTILTRKVGVLEQISYKDVLKWGIGIGATLISIAAYFKSNIWL